MATLQRIDETYYLAFRYPPNRTGKQFKRSLETSEQSEAKEAKALVERTMRYLKDGVLTLADDCTDDDVWQFLRSGGRLTSLPTTRKRIKLKELSAEYFSEMPEITHRSTERIHHNHLLRIVGNEWFDGIEASSLRSYIRKRSKDDGIRGKKVSGDTIRKELASFRLLWNFAKSLGYVSGDCPLADVKQPKKAKKPPFMTWQQIETKIARGGLSDTEKTELWDCLFLDEQQIVQFLRHVDASTKGKGYRWLYPALYFCACTGARRSEMMRAQVDDIDFSNKRVMLREKKADKDHEFTFREVPLHVSLATVMHPWIKKSQGQLLFTSAEGNPLLRSCNKYLDRAAKGSKWEVLRGFHVLRHSFASNLARHGVDDRSIRKMMGHHTEEMTERYRHLFPEQQEKAVALLNY
jgi:integrase